eukprot:m.199459 g.199459  ORF g.199459 m.199459 type:complete len:422 (-) comp14946_c0_seq1:176-1441(-)
MAIPLRVHPKIDVVGITDAIGVQIGDIGDVDPIIYDAARLIITQLVEKAKLHDVLVASPALLSTLGVAVVRHDGLESPSSLFFISASTLAFSSFEEPVTRAFHAVLDSIYLELQADEAYRWIAGIIFCPVSKTVFKLPFMLPHKKWRIVSDALRQLYMEEVVARLGQQCQSLKKQLAGNGRITKALLRAAFLQCGMPFDDIYAAHTSLALEVYHRKLESGKEARKKVNRDLHTNLFTPKYMLRNVRLTGHDRRALNRVTTELRTEFEAQAKTVKDVVQELKAEMGRCGLQGFTDKDKLDLFWALRAMVFGPPSCSSGIFHFACVQCAEDHAIAGIIDLMNEYPENVITSLDWCCFRIGVDKTISDLDPCVICKHSFLSLAPNINQLVRAVRQYEPPSASMIDVLVAIHSLRSFERKSMQSA